MALALNALCTRDSRCGNGIVFLVFGAGERTNGIRFQLDRDCDLDFGLGEEYTTKIAEQRGLRAMSRCTPYVLNEDEDENEHEQCTQVCAPVCRWLWPVSHVPTISPTQYFELHYTAVTAYQPHTLRVRTSIHTKPQHTIATATATAIAIAISTKCFLGVGGRKVIRTRPVPILYYARRAPLLKKSSPI